jgi:hypothetical protein
MSVASITVLSFILFVSECRCSSQSPVENMALPVAPELLEGPQAIAYVHMKK